MLLVTNSISSMLYLPCILSVPTPDISNLGSALSPLVITSTVLNARVLILALGPAVTLFASALENV